MKRLTDVMPFAASRDQDERARLNLLPQLPPFIFWQWQNCCVWHWALRRLLFCQNET